MTMAYVVIVASPLPVSAIMRPYPDVSVRSSVLVPEPDPEPASASSTSGGDGGGGEGGGDGAGVVVDLLTYVTRHPRDAVGSGWLSVIVARLSSTNVASFERANSPHSS